MKENKPVRRKRQTESRPRKTTKRESMVRKTKTDPSHIQEAKERLTVLAQTIDDNRVEIEVRQVQLSEASQEAFELMNALKMTEYAIPRVGTHIVETKKGNASSKVDIEKFWEQVTEEDFFKTVTVTKTAASEVLPSKVIETISTTTPGKMKPPVYKFEPAGNGK